LYSPQTVSPGRDLRVAGGRDRRQVRRPWRARTAYQARARGASRTSDTGGGCQMAALRDMGSARARPGPGEIGGSRSSSLLHDRRVPAPIPHAGLGPGDDEGPPSRDHAEPSWRNVTTTTLRIVRRAWAASPSRPNVASTTLRTRQEGATSTVGFRAAAGAWSMLSGGPYPEAVWVEPVRKRTSQADTPGPQETLLTTGEGR